MIIGSGYSLFRREEGEEYLSNLEKFCTLVGVVFKLVRPPNEVIDDEVMNSGRERAALAGSVLLYAEEE